MSKVSFFVFVCFLWVFPAQSQSFFEVLQDLTGIGESSTPDKLNPSSPPEAEIHPDAASIEELIIDFDQLPPSKNLQAQGVILHGLDKETARVFSMEAAVGEEIQFGTLKVKVHHCEMAPPDKRPESMAFLSIKDVKNGSEEVPVFTGWMFSSSPALSALDHPVYDLWVKNCVIQDR